MKVFKFGGASIKDIESIINVKNIIKSYTNDLVIVASAMGKTTNALEDVIQAKQNGELEQAHLLWHKIYQSHLETAQELNCATQANNKFTSINVYVNARIDSTEIISYDEMYDQIICAGELMSTCIISTYFNNQGIANTWVDARDIIKTNDRYRSADILWHETEIAVKKTYSEVTNDHQMIITQGFIGSTKDNQATTLGREGSDYTAAIISYCLDAEYVAIWKDVPGVLTADPRKIPEAFLLQRLSYQEAIELTYYGAQVIHPKTIQPIQEKKTALHVKSFLNPEGQGTIIDEDGDSSYPPLTVITENQYLLKFSTKDFSFIAEEHLSMLFRKFNQYRIRVNLMRNTAISFTICASAEVNKLAKLKEELKQDFTITEQAGLQLITVRHYHMAAINALKQNRKVLFEEIHGITYQMVVNPQN